ncbi:GNAT family N-acetyltransferase [Biformimicrobium ophioploci]|uniref:GNAT family N-acetyltransferase n=1 Tax=Biformimicrobium ophioploci TaxID=3036711 RepID=A0ABQ6LYK6_9GAMM|nr:GNAT family N-acetyltransferase [Microbulbifer sp. NKW57]GMG87143.1 GNAT family N-acetyltransferase [Microbulbifer sp. NKW57]
MTDGEAVVTRTPRLRLRRLRYGDAAFIVAVLNTPGFLRFVGDRKIRTEADARCYLDEGPLKMYRERGFGLWLVERSSDGVALGLCGLIKRDSLEDVDIGYGFLPEHEGQGYALEAARTVVAHAEAVVGLDRLVAICDPQNAASIRLLEKLGMEIEGQISAEEDGKALHLFSIDLASPGANIA